MRLVEFEYEAGEGNFTGVVFINPEFVSHVRQAGTGADISMRWDSFRMKESVETVVKRLQEAE